MPEGVKKTKRRYESPRRREQAAVTRRAILDAAQRLFEDHGYAATSMAAIAAEAGVSPRTVYLAFETKSALLRALWHLLLRGERDAVPVAEQAWYREVVEESDPERMLRLNARNSRIVKERAGALMEVIRTAAPSEPDIEGLWDRIQTDFYDNQRSILKLVQGRGGLAPGLDLRRATDVLWTLNHPDVYRLLVKERGWSPARYERWLGDTLCAQLLPAA